MGDISINPTLAFTVSMNHCVFITICWNFIYNTFHGAVHATESVMKRNYQNSFHCGYFCIYLKKETHLQTVTPGKGNSLIAVIFGFTDIIIGSDEYLYQTCNIK